MSLYPVSRNTTRGDTRQNTLGSVMKDRAITIAEPSLGPGPSRAVTRRRKHRLLHNPPCRTPRPGRNNPTCATDRALPKKPLARCASIPNTTSNPNNGEDRCYECVDPGTLTKEDQQDILHRLQQTNTQITREIEEIRELQAIVEELTNILREIQYLEEYQNVHPSFHYHYQHKLNAYCFYAASLGILLGVPKDLAYETRHPSN